jgi:hypothetical protein
VTRQGPLSLVWRFHYTPATEGALLVLYLAMLDVSHELGLTCLDPQWVGGRPSPPSQS